MKYGQWQFSHSVVRDYNEDYVSKLAHLASAIWPAFGKNKVNATSQVDAGVNYPRWHALYAMDMNYSQGHISELTEFGMEIWMKKAA